MASKHDEAQARRHDREAAEYRVEARHGSPRHQKRMLESAQGHEQAADARRKRV